MKSAIVDGEIIVLNEAGPSDFGELRKGITRRAGAQGDEAAAT
ncbi:hypothetical protein [Mesorhizobium japonicum]|nr:hypothetical protein [Mesorhizobium japonicum]